MPMHLENYPKGWHEISKRIRERDGWKCVKCGVNNGAVGCRDQYGNFYTEEDIDRDGKAPGAVLGKVIKVVLTVAHLHNPDPMDCQDENLSSMCQRCHLRYDAEQHRTNAAATRLKKKIAAGQLPMFDYEDARQ